MKLSISENKDPDPNMGFWGTRAGGIPRILSWLSWGGGLSQVTGSELLAETCLRQLVGSSRWGTPREGVGPLSFQDLAHLHFLPPNIGNYFSHLPYSTVPTRLE